MRTALVTGANRGLGLETAHQLAKLGYHVILTSRNTKSGEAKTSELAQLGLKVSFAPLDVSVESSINSLAEHVLQEFGGVDVVINNAGIFLESTGSDFSPQKSRAMELPSQIVLKTFETNTLGAYRVIQAFLPAMQTKNYGRIVNVSSGMGSLSEMQGGFPAYRISKTALNAVTRVFAAETRHSDILINSVCPGWVKTDMGGSKATRSLQEGVDTIVWAATLPTGGPTGLFFRDKKPLNW